LPEGPTHTIRPAELDAVIIAAIHQADAQVRVTRTIAGTAAACTAACSVGYVVWTVQSGVLMASYLSGLSVVQTLDPLPVLEFAEAGAARRRRVRRGTARGDEGDVRSLVA
jgi:hypothetical protein